MFKRSKKEENKEIKVSIEANDNLGDNDTNPKEKKRKLSPAEEDRMANYFPTFSRTYRIIGIILLIVNVVGTLIIKTFWMPWVDAHRELYQAIGPALFLLSLSYIVLARRKFEDDHSRNLMNRTNWFITRFTIYYSIYSYIQYKIFHTEVRLDVFLIILNATHLIYYLIIAGHIKRFYEKLVKIGKSKD